MIKARVWFYGYCQTAIYVFFSIRICTEPCLTAKDSSPLVLGWNALTDSPVVEEKPTGAFGQETKSAAGRSCGRFPTFNFTCQLGTLLLGRCFSSPI